MLPAEEKVFETFFNFVYDRIYLLDAEIEKEEISDPSESKAIIVEILKRRISFKDYSPELTEKLQSCFTEHDHKILELRFKEAFGDPEQ